MSDLSTGILRRCATEKLATFRQRASRSIISTPITAIERRAVWLRAGSNSTQVSASHLRVLAQGRRSILQNDPPCFQHVTVTRDFKGQIRVLFHQKNRDSVLPIDFYDLFKNRFYQQW